LKFVFFGTPNIASETLEILKSNGFLPTLIVTSPDKPQGRKMILTPTPVKAWALQNNIPFLQPEKLDKDFADKLTWVPGTQVADKVGPCPAGQGPTLSATDLFIVVAYGKIIPETIINMPKFGSLNIHYSILPKYRGASPVEAAILNGDQETGVSIQKMEYKMDSGPIVAQEKVTIEPDEKASELCKNLITVGGKILVKILPPYLKNEIIPIPQNELEVTYCKKIKKEDGLVNLKEESAISLYNKFRAYDEGPRIYYFDERLPVGKNRIVITEAVLENGNFIIKKVIPESKKETSFENFEKNLK
jgi:methionyl-tRNA formyltransferase